MGGQRRQRLRLRCRSPGAHSKCKALSVCTHNHARKPTLIRLNRSYICVTAALAYLWASMTCPSPSPRRQSAAVPVSCSDDRFDPELAISSCQATRQIPLRLHLWPPSMLRENPRSYKLTRLTRLLTHAGCTYRDNSNREKERSGQGVRDL